MGVGKAYVYLIFVDKLLAKCLEYVARLWKASNRKTTGKNKARDAD